MEHFPIAVAAVVSLIAILALYRLNLAAMQERRDMLDRIQSPDVAGYEARKSGEYLRESAAQAQPVKVKEDILDRRPWEHDPEYSGFDFHVDHERNLMEYIDDQQELHRVDLQAFLARYR